MYDPRINSKRHTFGVSGKLYKAALVMYDRQTESLWSQILQQAITGPMTGTKLPMLPAKHTTWEDWQKQHPGTLVLSPDTGFKRDYGLNRYAEYWSSGRPPRFRKAPSGAREDVKIKPMERVLGVQVDGVIKAYPFSVLRRKPAVFEDSLAGSKIRIHFDQRAESAYVTARDDSIIPSMTAFWFAWQDFYPNTLVFQD